MDKAEEYLYSSARNDVFENEECFWEVDLLELYLPGSSFVYLTGFDGQKAKDLYPNLDAYTVYLYPKDHSLYPIYHADQLYWLDWFSKTRYNRAKQRFSKGFLQLNFE